MKIAYLFFAYRNPLLIQKEIEALSGSDSFFFVHLDRKSDLRDFEVLKGDNVHFLEDRVEVYWAEFSGVEAILRLIESGLRAPVRYDYFVLLSGSEYPLRDREYIHRFFQEHRGQEFIDLTAMPNEAAGRRLKHVNTLWIPSNRPYLRLAAKALTRLGLLRRDYRRHLRGLKAYGGHTWWALSREAVQYIVDFARENPFVADYFRLSPQPEELFFHTILGNSTFRERVRRNLLFEDWSAGGARPEMINEQHLRHFASNDAIIIDDIWGRGEALFARKFSDERLDLVEQAKAIVERKARQPRSTQGAPA